ncbi:hypothetical protein FH5_02460 [Priestia endophytica]|nr:hypothetical protein FH5_02460 [Priestia endophytica]
MSNNWDAVQKNGKNRGTVYVIHLIQSLIIAVLLIWVI